jgi:tetratricopeptide (TPR) repeat protein
MRNYRFIALLVLSLFVFTSATSEIVAGRKKEERVKEDDGASKDMVEAQRHYRYGYQYYQQGLLQKSEQELRLALQFQEQYPDATYVLSLLYLELGEFQRAIEMARLVLDANPMYSEAHNVMGLAHARMKDFKSALREFEAVKGDVNYPTPEVAHVNIGKVLADTGSCGDAQLHFRRAVEINPKMGKAWFLLGTCQELLGDLAAARKSLETAVQAMPGDKSAQVEYRLGVVCMELSDKVAAVQHFDRVMLLSPSSEFGTGARELKRQLHFR